MISSLENAQVKEAVHLRERHFRNKTDLFLIEGYREILRATERFWKLKHCFFCPELFLGSNEPALLEQAKLQGAKLIECTPKVFAKMSYRDRPDGLLAIAFQVKRTLEHLELDLKNIQNPLLVIAEAIEKPGNLGTILRSSDAAGAHGLILCNRCTDLFNPNVVRASCGTLFTVPLAEASNEETLFWLQKGGYQVLSAMPQAKTCYTDVDMKKPSAIVVGCEQLGLSEIWKRAASMPVYIPMCGRADSLNVAMATTLILYEAQRQRHAHPL
jgi:TrmH family RNA methyltransferase